MPDLMTAPAPSAPSVVPASSNTSPVTAAEIAADVAQHGGAHDESSSQSTGRNAIADASKALREQPRNADGTFAPVQAADAAAESPAEATEPASATETPAEGVEAVAEPAEAQAEAQAEAPEPKLFKLSGEAQRGESDIELDVSDLPPDVIERLERNEKRGMRRREYDDAMRRAAKADADRAEFETLVKLDAPSVVMEYMAPADRLEVGATILFNHWDELAPVIQQYWEDPAGRMQALKSLQDRASQRRSTVTTQAQSARFATQMARAIKEVIPDGVEPSDALAFSGAASTIIEQELAAGRQVTPESAPQLLAPLAARFGFQAAATDTPAEPPKRPKLAVHTNAPPVTAASAGTGTASRAPATTVASGAAVHPAMTPERFAEQTRARTAAKAVAPQGAGATPVKRPGPPANATIEQASAFLRGTTARR